MTADSHEAAPALVRHAVVDGVATITLARPQAGNAMSLAFMEALYEAVSAVTTDPETRAILIEAEGRHFCVGGDVRDFSDDADPGAYMSVLADRLHDSIKRLASHRAPVVVAVQGAAAGAGLSLVAGADIAVAGRTATFVMAYGALGLTADAGATWFLPRVIGLRLTQEMAFTGRRLNADEAERFGLVTRVVKDHRIAQEARDIAAGIARGPTAAFGSVKQLLATQSGVDLATQLDRERNIIADARTTADAREGVAAFLERRPPSFFGR